MNKVTPSGYMLLKHPSPSAVHRSSSAPASRRKSNECNRRSRSWSPQARTKSQTVLEEDKLGRVHYGIGRTGPVHIFCCSAKFNTSSSTKHCSDLQHLSHSLQPLGKTLLTVVVDGGPDWTFKSIANIIAMGRCWKKCNLDALLLVCLTLGRADSTPSSDSGHHAHVTSVVLN